MRQISIRALVALVLLVPAAPYLWRLPDFGRLPYNDYWGVLGELVEDGSLDLSPAKVLTLKSNEHTVIVPAALYLANVAVTDGDNRGHSVLVLCFLAATLWLLTRLLPTDLRASTVAYAFVGLTLSLFVFNVVQSHNVVMGFSGLMWILANLCAVVALVLLTRGAADPGRRWVWLAAAVGVLGALSYSTSLSLWPAVVVAGLLLGLPVRRLLPFLLAALAAYGFYAALYEKPAYHPDLARDPGVVAGYAASYLGSLFSSRPDVSATFGGLGLLVALAAAVLAVRRRSLRRELAPWLALQLYALGNALGTAVGRGGMPGNRGLASRYASLPALFWSSLLVTIFILWWRGGPGGRRGRVAAMTAGAFVVASLTAAMFARGWEHYEGLLDVAAEQPIAAAALHLGVFDEGLLRPITPWAVPHIPRIRSWLVAEGHVPFDRPPPFPLGEAIEGSRLENVNPRNVSGDVSVWERAGGDVWRIEGWAYSSTRTLTGILVLDGRRSFRGAGVLGRNRPDVARALGREEAIDSGWIGFVTADSGTRLRVYARMAENDKLVPIGPWHVAGD